MNETPSADDAERLAHAAILDQLAEGVIVTDAGGRITFVNGAAESIHGVAKLDVSPDCYSETYHLFTEDGRPYPTRDLPLARAVRGEIVRDERWRILRPNGTAVLAIGCARPLLGADGRQIGAVLTLRDDTARERAERDLRKLNTTLSERVAERTREAEAAREAAEAASRAKTDFLAAMSHEIRTPLSGILGYTDLLLEENDPLAVRRCAERIRTAGSALLTIVNDILDFAKVEAGRLELAAKPFELVRVADEAVEIVRGTAERKGLALNLAVGDGAAAMLVGDGDRLRQVLLNLLNNAVKFTRLGSVTLRLSLLGAEDGVAHMRMAVEDTGIGIAPAKRHLLFERFSQIDGSNQREYGGTGLGLAISKRLVELMGGTIDCESEIGRGSTFTLDLALPIADRGSVEVETAEPERTASRRLLLVEDVVINQELARAILERDGHVVHVASGGAEAVTAVQKTTYDLVLMDVQMPVIDGLTATRLIRALDHPASKVPIVAMSANVLPHQVALCREAGMQEHVGKPFRRDELLGAVARWAAAPAAEGGGMGHVDRAAFDALATPMGPVGTRRLLASFARELQTRLLDGAPTTDAASLAGQAHALVSAASMLGFSSFADLCRKVEAAGIDAEAGGDVERLAQSLRDGGRRVLTTVEALAAAA